MSAVIDAPPPEWLEEDGPASQIRPQTQSAERLTRSSSGAGRSATSRRTRQMRPDALARFWKRMVFDLGHCWTSRYGVAAFTDDGGLTEGGAHWSEALADLSLDAISAGLTAMRDAGANWFPTVPAFRELCRRSVPSTRPEHQPYRALPRPEPNPEVATRYRAQVKAAARESHRCVTSPGYGLAEYERDIAEAQREGRSLYDVDMAARARNGWTEEDEVRHRAAWCSLPHLGPCYRRGHEPRSAS